MFIITPSLSPSICATQDVTDSLSRGKALRGYSVRCPEACCDLCFFINEVQNSWTEKRLIHLVEHFLRIPTPYPEKLSSLKMNCCSNFPVASFHWTFAVFFFFPLSYAALYPDSSFSSSSCFKIKWDVEVGKLRESGHPFSCYRLWIITRLHPQQFFFQRGGKHQDTLGSASASPNSALGRVIWFMGSVTLPLIPQQDTTFISLHKCLKRLVV